MYIFEHYIGNLPLAVYILVALAVVVIVSEIIMLLLRAPGRVNIAVLLIELCLVVVVSFGLEIYGGNRGDNSGTDVWDNRSDTVEEDDEWLEYLLSLSKEEVVSEAVKISGGSEITHETLMRNSMEYVGMFVELECTVGTLIQMDNMEYKQYYIGSYNGWAEEPRTGFFNDFENYCLHDYRGLDATYMLEDDEVTIYGAFVGVSDYEMVEGGNAKAPDIIVLYVDFYK